MKKLANLKPGAYFFYGGVQWVVLENNDKIGATLSIAAEPVFNRAFDEENRNDWRVSSLRRELNGPFFDALIAEGANRAAFLVLGNIPYQFQSPRNQVLPHKPQFCLIRSRGVYLKFCLPALQI